MVFRKRIALSWVTILILAISCQLPDTADLNQDGCGDGGPCTTAELMCGNGIEDTGEECDDGNKVTETCAYGETACLVCNASCKKMEGDTSFCGDNRIDAENSEECDDGNTENGDGCTATCQLPACGDGQLDSDEECDDGNDINTDSCTNNCLTPQCGDGIISNTGTADGGPGDYNETCDDNNNLTETCSYGETACSVCDSTCTLVAGVTSFCGDETTDEANGESCDNGEDNNDSIPDACRTNCQLPFCSDGIVDTGEECDLGVDNENAPSCNTDCQSTAFLIKDTNTSRTDDSVTTLMGHLGDVLFYYTLMNGLYADLIAYNTATETKTVVHPHLLDYSMPAPTLGSFATANGKLFYLVAEDSTKVSLWCTDGTIEGTLLLKEFSVGGSFDFRLLGMYRMVAIPPIAPEAESTSVLFLGEDDEYGLELWRSSGTVESTTRVTDLEPGTGSIQVNEIEAHEDKVYFVAETTVQGDELWYTQGTVETTFMLTPLGTDEDGGNFDNLTSTENGLFFSAQNDEHPYRLNNNNIEMLPSLIGSGNVTDVSQFISVGDNVVFIGETIDLGEELFVFDPQANTVINLADINPGSSDSYVHSLQVTDNNLLFFVARDDNGMSLWVSDGTPDIVTKFLSNHDGIDEERSYPFSSSLFKSHVIGSTLIFSAYKDNEEEKKLWATTGLFNTADLIVDIPIDFNSIGQDVQTKNNPFYFNGQDPVKGFEPWRTDGTTGGTQMLVDLNEQTSSIRPFTGFGIKSENNFLYIAYADDTKWGLYKSDGTETGTSFVKTISNHHTPVDESFIGTFNDFFFFTADDVVHGVELWRTDGTADGTFMVKDIFEGSEDGVNITSGLQFNDAFYFSAKSSHDIGYELWKTDGTESGTSMVKDIYVGEDDSYPKAFIIFQERLFFQAENDAEGRELWVSDGTEAGTVLHKDTYVGAANGSPENMRVINGKLIFSARASNTGAELWVDDGSQVTMLPELYNGNNTGFYEFFAQYDNSLYFKGNSQDTGMELWKTDGINHTLVVDLSPGAPPSNPSLLGTINNYLIFLATTEDYGEELWSLNMDDDTVVLLKDLIEGPDDGNWRVIIQPTTANNLLYFVATLAEFGSQVWTTDGTVDGTQPAFKAGDYRWDLPSLMTDFTDHMLFFARDASRGNELWRYNYPFTP